MKKVITEFLSEYEEMKEGAIDNFDRVSNNWPPCEDLECREPFTLEDGSVYTG